MLRVGGGGGWWWCGGGGILAGLGETSRSGKGFVAA